jgi:hypothetical protein
MNSKPDITHENLAFYLERKGWRKSQSNRPAIDIFSEPAGENPLEIPIPNKEVPAGYTALISDAINILATLEERPASLVVRAIKSIDRDLHDYRVLGGNSESIAMPLLHELIGCTRELIHDSNRYLQTVENRDRRNRKKKGSRPSPKLESLEYVKDCRFAHTWKGSFGITIETPLWLPSIGMFADIPETIGRKTTRRILDGYNILMKSVQAESYSYILETIKDKHQLLMFEKFLALTDFLKDDSIDVSVELSPSISADESLKNISKAMINQKVLKNIDKAVEHLRNPIEELDIDIVGFPETISATMEGLLHDLTDEQGRVTVKGQSPHIGSCALRMQLAFEDYRKALLAQENVKPVRVKCRVRKQIKGWDVIRVDSFQLLD